MISFQSLKLLAASSLLAISVSLPSHAGVHVNVNVGIGTPGYYGVLPIQGVTPSLWNAGPGWDHRPPPRGPHACPRPAKSHDWNDHRGPGRKRGHHKDD